MRNTVHEIAGCHTVNLRHAALQISFRINCSNKVFAFFFMYCWVQGVEPSPATNTLKLKSLCRGYEAAWLWVPRVASPRPSEVLVLSALAMIL
jgi:hypothetical protein